MSVLFATIWLITSLALATYFALLWLKIKTINPLDLAAYLAPAFVAFGSVWLVAANAEIELLGFGETIVLLTAAHFHAAGGCLIALTALIGSKRSRTIDKIASALAIISIPITAIGIQIGGVTEGIGAACTVFAAMFFAIVQLTMLDALSTFAKTLRITSSISLIIAMGFAFAYSLQHYGLNINLTIDTMILWHASLNVFGFIACGLGAFALSKSAT